MSIRINAGYIKCRADAIGCKPFEVRHPSLKEPVEIVAVNARDAEVELEARIGDILRKHPELSKLRHRRECPTCGGEGEIDL